MHQHPPERVLHLRTMPRTEKGPETRPNSLPIAFTAAERALIRPEMSQHVGQYPGLAHGIFLRAWRAAPARSPAMIA